MAGWILIAAVAAVAPQGSAQTEWVEAKTPPVAALQGGGPDFAALAKFASRSVVSITATAPSEHPSIEGSEDAREFFERFYGSDEPPTKGLASGFVIRSDGYVLTNAHVVEDSAALSVTLGVSDDRAWPARVVGRDEMSDLALIKIDVDRPLEALPLGDSDSVNVGDWVTAIGNPFGLSHSVTVGVVSFIGRRDVNPSGRPGYYDFIQTDASINPGNSGGPLLDRHGRVIGISAAVNATGQGIGFAIPVNMAKDILPALYADGAVQRSFLGVAIQDLSPELARSFGVESGVVVTEVSKGSPAEAAGLKVGDVVKAFEGEPIDSSARLRWLAGGAGIGKKVALAYRRDGKEMTADVTLAPLPGARKAFERTPPPRPRPELAPLGFAVGKRVKGPHGEGLRVESIDPMSRAYVAGLREGDLVLQVGSHRLKSEKELTKHAKSGVVRLYVQRGLRPLFVAFELE